MIRYSLHCSTGHGFESWFQSAAAFDTLKAGRMLACPDCGSTDVSKSLMAPQVQPSDRNDLAATKSAKETALAGLRRHVEENSDYVGLEFAAKARAMHDGLIPDRPIHGEAKLDEARALIEDGIPVAPLPFLPSRKVS